MSPSRRPSWLHWVPAVAWAALIFVLSSQSWLPGPPGGMSDKHAHAATFGVLALTCIHGLVRGRWRRVDARGALVGALLAVVYGLSDEWHQSFVPGRAADWADVRADALGAFGAAALGWAWAILLRRRAPRQAFRH